MSKLASFCYALSVIFCALRACDVVTWAWYYVLFPVIVCEGYALLMGILGAVIGCVDMEDDDEEDEN